MKRFSLHLLVALFSALTLTSCKTAENVATSQDVPYVVADHYFLRNDVTALPQGIITSEAQFQSLFGMAPVMGGKDAMPTAIDFKKQFVIAVCVPETDRETDIKPLSLHSTKQNLVFTYEVVTGEKRSYTIQPVLLIIVDKKYEAPLQMLQK